MKSEKIKELLLGGVYKTELSPNPVRIIACDSNQVFYDTWWEHTNDWGYRDSLKRKVFFYRSSPERFLTSSIFLRTEPLTDIEQKVYRPDLPFSVCRNIQLSWTDEIFSTIDEYKSCLLSKSINANDFTGLNISEIILVPFGLKGGHKKSVQIKAINSTYFKGIELLWNAHNIQAPYINGNIEAGVGLYRLGFEKGIPSYYIGGYYDSAGLLKD